MVSATPVQWTFQDRGWLHYCMDRFHERTIRGHSDRFAEPWATIQCMSTCREVYQRGSPINKKTAEGRQRKTGRALPPGLLGGGVILIGGRVVTWPPSPDRSIAHSSEKLSRPQKSVICHCSVRTRTRHPSRVPWLLSLFPFTKPLIYQRYDMMFASRRMLSKYNVEKG